MEHVSANVGLPPTPIANPGPGVDPGGAATRPRTRRRATRSASICRIPTQCFYLYYVLGNEDGSHVFAATAEQHDANVDARGREAGLL